MGERQKNDVRVMTQRQQKIECTDSDNEDETSPPTLLKNATKKKDILFIGLASIVSSSDEEVLGSTTEASRVTSSPAWDKLITPVRDLTDDETITVHVYKASEDLNTPVASANFPLRKITGAYFKAAASFTTQETDAGAKIAIHGNDEPVMGQLRLTLAGHDLPNTDFSLFRKNLSDPYFEVYSAVTGKKLYASNVVKDDLNPVWEPMDLDIDELCGGRLEAPIRITVLDKDKGEKSQYLGQIVTTLAQMTNPESGIFPLVKGGTEVTQGYLTVKEAILQSAQLVSREARKHMEVVLKVLDSNRGKLLNEVETQRETATQAKAQADELSATIPVLTERVNKLAQVQAKAQTEYAVVKETYTKLKEAGPCSGSLNLQLRASKLPDTDFGIRNKSDPFYEIFLENKERLLRSNIVENNLNPKWLEQIVDIGKVGGLEKSITISVSDKDGGDKQTYMGSITTTLQSLIDAAGSETGQRLVPCKGLLFVDKAELHHFQDNVTAAQELYSKSVEPAAAACQKATQEFEEVRKTVDDARAKVAAAKEAAQKAEDAADAAQEALAQMEKAG
eukprot:scaffold3740_cov146-Amphora_coffeaeformis.AAC.4